MIDLTSTQIDISDLESFVEEYTQPDDVEHAINAVYAALQHLRNVSVNNDDAPFNETAYADVVEFFRASLGSTLSPEELEQVSTVQAILDDIDQSGISRSDSLISEYAARDWMEEEISNEYDTYSFPCQFIDMESCWQYFTDNTESVDIDGVDYYVMELPN